MSARCVPTPVYCPFAGGGGSFEGRAGMSSEVDGIIEKLMVAMSIGQTVGQYHHHHMAGIQLLTLQHLVTCIIQT